MSDIKLMDIKEFRETGFLQEANRQFFHPHGLALQISLIDENGWKKTVEERDDELVERVRVVIAQHFNNVSDTVINALTTRVLDSIYPPGSEFLSGVWDNRDDPEGVWFDFETWIELYPDKYDAPGKAARVREERAKHRVNRDKLFKEKLYEGRYANDDSVFLGDIEPIP